MLLQDSVPHSWSEAGQQDAPLPGLATQIPASSECFMFAPPYPYTLFELINQNNLVPSLSTLHACVPEYSSNSHACLMTIGPAPRIMIYFQSVLFPTFKPSTAASITKTALHLNFPGAYPEGRKSSAAIEADFHFLQLLEYKNIRKSLDFNRRKSWPQ
ncbi:hypothetical protein SLEP1_g54163 [Rubroshorea leprosula]|uniref:Uncharacterized protein n=1 Tax=Rubroshorea leprosula TaxID=152421 RepID=A0AAV5MBI7_9ROSI|nr:hypothetical protein SLEP1_g54163 [Rubroshorea leprosula]